MRVNLLSELSIEAIAVRVGAYTPGRVALDETIKQAAVAAILRHREGSHALEVLLIRRAEDPRDPWSGHMAFPGGRVDPTDVDAHAAAIREVHEEVGVDLVRFGRPLGELSHLMATARGRPLQLAVVPFVFALSPTPPFLLSDEVQEAIWVPLAHLADPASRETMERTYNSMTVLLPCVRYEGRVIWGLTLKMIDELIAVTAGGPEQI